MYKYCFAILFSALAATTIVAQEAGFIAGASEYGGDLAKTPFILDESELGGTLFYRHYLTDNISARGSLSYGKIAGNDLNKQSSFIRNLNFESTIFEFAAVATYDLKDISYDDTVPYVYGGLAYFRHNPKANLNGTMVELQPLGTEGQGIAGFGDAYSLNQFAIPMGVGVKKVIADNILIIADYSAKKTFTDHLDDVSRFEYVPLSTFQNAYAGTDPAKLALLEQLAYRGDEIQGGRPYAAFEDAGIRQGDPRNISDDKDWYYLFGVGASYYFASKNRNPIEKNRKKVPYTRGGQKKIKKKGESKKAPETTPDN